MLAALTLVVSACRVGAGKPFAEQFGSLQPGRYFTTKFKPALSFEVGEGCRVHIAEEPTNFTIQRQATNELTFANPSKVYDPTNPAELVSTSHQPAEWVSWFREHPYLETSKPEPASIAGVEGERFETIILLCRTTTLASGAVATFLRGRYAVDPTKALAE